jgi:hypothetical protein
MLFLKVGFSKIAILINHTFIKTTSWTSEDWFCTVIFHWLLRGDSRTQVISLLKQTGQNRRLGTSCQAAYTTDDGRSLTPWAGGSPSKMCYWLVGWLAGFLTCVWLQLVATSWLGLSSIK